MNDPNKLGDVYCEKCWGGMLRANEEHLKCRELGHPRCKQNRPPKESEPGVPDFECVGRPDDVLVRNVRKRCLDDHGVVVELPRTSRIRRSDAAGSDDKRDDEAGNDDVFCMPCYCRFLIQHPTLQCEPVQDP